MIGCLEEIRGKKHVKRNGIQRHSKVERGVLCLAQISTPIVTETNHMSELHQSTCLIVRPSVVHACSCVGMPFQKISTKKSGSYCVLLLTFLEVSLTKDAEIQCFHQRNGCCFILGRRLHYELRRIKKN